MFFLSKKKLYIIIICLLLFIIFFVILKKQNIIETVALPVENKVIIIDAGHGLPDNRSFK